jgi:integrase
MPVDNRFLEKRRQGWYAVVEIPPLVRPVLGKKRLRASLNTRDVTVARVRRWEVVGKFKHIIRQAKEGETSQDVGIKGEASAWRNLFAAEADETNQEALQSQLEDRAEELATTIGYPAAKAFYDVASGQSTPIDTYLDRWLLGSTYTARTKADHRHALKLFLDWMERRRKIVGLEALDSRSAADFRDDALIAQRVHPKTANKALSGLRSYWKWMVTSGFVAHNPWVGKTVATARAHRESPEARERAFTPDEIGRLLAGDADAVLSDIMRIAALSGMRLEEICQLRVRDCERDSFSVRMGKTAAARREVPIHSDLRSIINRRTGGRSAESFIFPELKSTGWDGARSMAISKRFGYYRVRCGVDDSPEGRRRSRVNFHSFRRWFVTEAERAGQMPWVIETVVGHKRQGMSLGRYSEGSSSKQMRDCVEAVKLP